MGIENLEKVVGFAIDLGGALMAAAKESTPLGRAAAMLHLIEDAPMLMSVDYSALEAEVKALTPEELDQLNAYIDANVSLPDADKQAKVLAVVSVVIELAKVAEKAIAMWSKKPAEAAVAADAPAPSAP